MKRILLLSLFTVFVANIQVVAQTDYTKLSVTYNEYYLRFEEDDSLFLDIRRLDIGDYSSYYHSLIREWYMLHSEGRAPYPGTRSRDGSDFVFKNMPKKGIITFKHMPFHLTTQDSIQ
jgi:hypothetical protein